MGGWEQGRGREGKMCPLYLISFIQGRAIYRTEGKLDVNAKGASYREDTLGLYMQPNTLMYALDEAKVILLEVLKIYHF